ncbi:MAG: class II aldolase/adducin family protein [Christensenellales bacterium]
MDMKQKVLDTMNRVYHSSLTSTSGGNISAIDDDGHIFITPSGKDKGTLEVNDIAEVLPDGTRIGQYAPSMELPFHSNIYKMRADVKAVVHAHAPAVVAYATARKVPDSSVARVYQDVLGEVVGSCYELPGSLKLGEIVKAQFEKGYNAVMMDNHGATVADSNLDKAFMRYETLDCLCQTLINAGMLGGVKIPQRVELKKADFCVIEDKSEAFENIKKEICDFCHRSYNNKLMASTFGTIAVRAGDGFLFNPDSADRKTVSQADIVYCTGGNLSSFESTKYLAYIKEIFDNKPEVNCVIISMPSATMGFAVAHKPLNARLIPESYIMLRDVTRAEYDVIAEPKKVSDLLNTKAPALIIDNEGVFAIGRNVTKTFDRLEVLDYSARSIISALAIADIVPINDKQVDEINDTFNGW